MTKEDCKNKCNKVFKKTSNKDECSKACELSSKIQCQIKCTQKTGAGGSLKCLQACNKK